MKRPVSRVGVPVPSGRRSALRVMTFMTALGTVLPLAASAVRGQETPVPNAPERTPPGVGTVVVPYTDTVPPASPAGSVTRTVPVSTPLSRSGDAWRRGDPDSALREAEEGLKADDRQPDLLNWYGYLLLRRSRTDDARTVFEKAYALGNPTPELRLNLAATLLFPSDASGDNLRRAVELLEAAVAADPARLDAQANLGHAYLRTNRPAEAAAAYATVLDREPDNAPILRMRGYALLKADRPGEAIAALRQAVRLAPTDGEAHALLGSALLGAGRDEEASEALEAARKHGPPNAVVLSNLGMLRMRRQEWEQAREVYAAAAERAEAETPPDRTPRVRLGIVLARLGRWSEAATAYETVLAADPRQYDARLNLGTVRFRQGRLSDAVREFGVAARQRPTDPLAWANLATAQEAARNAPAALQAWKRAAAAEPGNRQYALRLREAALRANRPEVVIGTVRPETAQTAADLTVLGTAHYRKAEQSSGAAAKQRNLVEALRAFERAVKRAPTSPSAWNNLGVVYERRGQINAALRAYKNALRYNPAFGPARANLARFVPTTALPRPSKASSGSSRSSGKRQAP
ncbi:MAG: tetratricopeptide repeat protein [Capsulimonadales bacterium]|nr:tetratricopeptide repeat protein [Capsulimonadales bacterium]